MKPIFEVLRATYMSSQLSRADSIARCVKHALDRFDVSCHDDLPQVMFASDLRENRTVVANLGQSLHDSFPIHAPSRRSVIDEFEMREVYRRKEVTKDELAPIALA